MPTETHIDYRAQNISALADYYAAGCKQKKLLGLELEHFVVDKQTRRSLTYDNGVAQILTRLLPLYGGAPILSQGQIIGIMKEGAPITLEPAAQLEISIGPCHKIAEIAQIYNAFTAIITPILDDMGCELVCVGYHPKSKVDELPLIPKQRYEYMDAHFKSTGTRGKNMMKGSGATQVSIDYENETDFSKKFRVANILGPLLSLICDNTPVFEGEPFKGRMARTFIWNDVDPARSMVVKGALDGEFGFYEYAKYIYDLPSVLMIEDGEAIFTGPKPVSELFAKRTMILEDMIHASTMAFPDVCLKTHIEIRMADSMSIEYALAYVALLQGIFYNSSNLDKLYQMTLGIGNSQVMEAKAKLMEKGADAEVYGKRGANWIAELFQIAENGLNADEIEYLKPLKEKKI